jgi:anti-sigma-K factor RskA
MPHYDEETLALLALGERGVTSDAEAHLETCPGCRAEIEELRAAVAIGRGLTTADHPVDPPTSVWRRIADEVGLDTPNTDVPAGPTPIRARARTRRSPVVLAAAAGLVGLLVGTAATLVVTRDGSTPTSTSPAVVAEAVLQPLDTPTAHGTAVIGKGNGDQRTLTVEVQDLPSVPGTFYEVWLMNAAPQRLVSLGVLDSAHAGVFQIPPGLDLGSYPVVDVSLQPFNGSPDHSGTSAVRGTLSA